MAHKFLLALSSLEVIQFVLVSGGCNNGWVRFNDSCYLFPNVYADWNEAEFHCISLYGGYLVEIGSAKENAFVVEEAKIHHAADPSKDNVGYWLGGSDVEVEGTFIWMKSRTQFSFTDWEPDNPSNTRGHEDCVHMDAVMNFKWNDNACSVKAYFICEMPANPDRNEILG